MWNACIVRRDKQRKKKRKTWKRRRHEETSGTLKDHLLVTSSPWDVFSLATTHWTWSLGSLSGLFVLRYLPIWLCGAPRHVAADRRTFSRRDSMNFRKQELDMVQEQNKETRKETTYKNKKRLRKRLIKRLCKRLVNSYKLLHLSPPLTFLLFTIIPTLSFAASSTQSVLILAYLGDVASPHRGCALLHDTIPQILTARPRLLTRLRTTLAT